jgi:hypothetical protein
MPESFKHPLARSACRQLAVSVDGAARPMLVVVTTLQLDPSREGYKKSLVDKLSSAAKEHLSRFPSMAGFVLINCLKDWGA